MAEKRPVLEVQDAKKYYISRKKHVMRDGRVVHKAEVKSVDGVSFALEAGEVLGVIGESGCGKSTLGRLIVRLEPPTAGKVLYNGEDAENLIKRDKLAFRRYTQMVFQNPFDTFDPRYTIEKILMRPLKLHGIGKEYDDRHALLVERLERAGLRPAEQMLQRYPHELSGGQLQRISIIRSLLLDPKVIVADEPVSMLDVSVRAEIINTLYDAAKAHDLGLVFISHDISLTRYVSDHIAVMYLGHIVEYGTAEQVVDHPVHPYTKVLLSNSPSVDPLAKKTAIKMQGEPPTPVDVPPGCPFSRRCPDARPECATTQQYLNEIHGRLVSCSCAAEDAGALE